MISVDDLAVAIHQTAVNHGFWPVEGRNLGEMLMLVTSECAEALEEDRAGNPVVYFLCSECGYSDMIHYTTHYRADASSELRVCGNNNPKPEGALVEVVDAIIRLLDMGHDMASKTRYTIGDVMLRKMNYNDTRPHKHGKAY